MDTQRDRRRGALFFALGTAWALASPGQAAAQIGEPATISDTDGRCAWTATIHAAFDLGPRDSAQLANALNAQGFNEEGGWSVDFAGRLSEGSLSIDTYYAWVSSEPSVTCGGHTVPGTETGRIGGAAFCLDYAPGETDPSGSEVHWVQAIRTDCPSFFGLLYGVPGADGFFDYLDNEGNGLPGGVNPFYDTAGEAGSTYFLDVPFRRCSSPPDCVTTCTWDAAVFLAVGDISTHDLRLYATGFEWGFTFECVPVPGPAPAVVLVLGALGACRRRR